MEDQGDIHQAPLDNAKFMTAFKAMQEKLLGLAQLQSQVDALTAQEAQNAAANAKLQKEVDDLKVQEAQNAAANATANAKLQNQVVALTAQEAQNAAANATANAKLQSEVRFLRSGTCTSLLMFFMFRLKFIKIKVSPVDRVVFILGFIIAVACGLAILFTDPGSQVAKISIGVLSMFGVVLSVIGSRKYFFPQQLLERLKMD
jgi:hypothetical protein